MAALLLSRAAIGIIRHCLGDTRHLRKFGTHGGLLLYRLKEMPARLMSASADKLDKLFTDAVAECHYDADL